MNLSPSRNREERVFRPEFHYPSALELLQVQVRNGNGSALIAEHKADSVVAFASVRCSKGELIGIRLFANVAFLEQADVVPIVLVDPSRNVDRSSLG